MTLLATALSGGGAAAHAGTAVAAPAIVRGGVFTAFMLPGMPLPTPSIPGVGAGGIMGAAGGAAGAGLGGKAMYHYCEKQCVAPAQCFGLKQCLDQCANKAFLAGAAGGGAGSLAGSALHGSVSKTLTGHGGPLDGWTAGPVLGVWNRLEDRSSGGHLQEAPRPRRPQRRHRRRSPPQATVKGSEEHQAEQASWRKGLAELKGKMGAAAGAGRGRGKGRGKAARGEAAGKRLPPGDLSAAVVQEFLPPPWRAYRGEAENRWQLTTRTATVSRSWCVLKSPRQAALEALREVWRRHELSSGQKCHHIGIFE